MFPSALILAVMGKLDYSAESLPPCEEEAHQRHPPQLSNTFFRAPKTARKPKEHLQARLEQDENICILA